MQYPCNSATKPLWDTSRVAFEPQSRACSFSANIAVSSPWETGVLQDLLQNFYREQREKGQVLKERKKKAVDSPVLIVEEIRCSCALTKERVDY